MNLNKVFLLLLCFSFFVVNSAFSQGGTWTWISGDSTLNSFGIYGMQGVPSVNNHPPAVYEPCEWKDKFGNFWLYGGMPTSDMYGDLWKYIPVTNEWTWVKGNGILDPPRLYGTKGVANAMNSPGGRELVTASWVDTAGNLWLFGGANPFDQELNDLWQYNILTNNWTWLSGDSIPNLKAVHGTQGVPSFSNSPGGRKETCAAWTDSLNNLWLFGGEGVDDIGNNGFLNDLWRFNIATNEWTWMKGSAFINAPVNYGNKRIANANNDPGARWAYSKWKDINENFWIMGGYPISVGSLNDLWKFDISINEWIWMYGPNTVADTGRYINYCTFDTINVPFARFEHRSSVIDNCGRFWLYGGQFHKASLFANLNDLWVFDSQQLKWEWLRGNNSFNLPGIYGIKGVPSLSNLPPSRRGAVAWWGNDNKFYLFGGGFYCYCDLWRFDADTNCISFSCTENYHPIASFELDITTLCSNDCISLTNLSTNATSYQWLFPGGTPSSSTDQNPQVCYLTLGIYNVTLVAFNSRGRDTLVLNNYITVNPPPVVSVTADTSLCIGSSVQLTASGGVSYIWSPSMGLNDSSFANPVASPVTTTNYKVSVTDSNGCRGYDSVMIVANPVTFTVSSDTAICLGSAIQLNASGGISYLWTPSAGLNDSTLANPVASPAANTQYRVEVTDSNLCSAYDSVTITVNPLPLLGLNTDTSLCDGASVQLKATGGIEYLWKPTTWLSDSTIANPVAMPSGTTTYTVNATDSNGCVGRRAITLLIYPDVPSTSIKQVGNMLYCHTDTSYISYQWYDDSMLVTGATDTFYVATHDGNYNIVVTDKNGCKTSAGINVVIMNVNNVIENIISFFPNPTTDELLISGNWQATGKLTIFNVLGETIYSDAINRKQETINCKPFPAGIYFVQITTGKARWVGRFVKE